MTSHPTQRVWYTCGVCFGAILTACGSGEKSGRDADGPENTDVACQEDPAAQTDADTNGASKWPIENEPEAISDIFSTSGSDGDPDSDSDNETDSGRGTDSDTEEQLEGSDSPSCFGPTVIDPDARACDLLLDVGTQPVDAVRFSTDTRGAVIQRPPRLVISMVTAEDAPFSENAVCLGGDAPHVTITRADCYDRLGVSLKGESAVLP